MKKCIFTIAALFIVVQSFGLKLPPLRELGFITGWGQGTSARSVREGDYHPIYFIAHLGFDLTANVSDENLRKGIFTMYNELQYNLVYIGRGESGLEYEFGLNNGFKYMYKVLPWFNVYVSGGTGPFYFSTYTGVQRQGFIFSNNFGIGTYTFISKHMAVHTAFRLRHMSNANLWTPNDGINTYNYHVGISWFVW